MLNSQQNMQQAPFTTKVYRQQICNKTKQVRNETATNPDETPLTPYYIIAEMFGESNFLLYLCSEKEATPIKFAIYLAKFVACLWRNKENRWYLIIYVNILQILRSLAITLQKKNPEIPKTIRNQNLLVSVRRKSITGNDCRDRKAGWE